MLPKEYRIPSPEIKRVMRRGVHAIKGAVVIISAKNNLAISRFAFIVPTKIDKRATVRNRMKRLLRERVRVLLPSLPAGRDVVIIARKKEASLDEKFYS